MRRSIAEELTLLRQAGFERPQKGEIQLLSELTSPLTMAAQAATVNALRNEAHLRIPTRQVQGILVEMPARRGWPDPFTGFARIQKIIEDIRR